MAGRVRCDPGWLKIVQKNAGHDVDKVCDDSGVLPDRSDSLRGLDRSVIVLRTVKHKTGRLPTAQLYHTKLITDPRTPELQLY